MIDTPRNLSYCEFRLPRRIVLVLQEARNIPGDALQSGCSLSFDSIQHIMRDVNYGWLLRYMHAMGVLAFFFVIFVHMVRTLYYGSYRAPRELLWWARTRTAAAADGPTAFMGYLLPWGKCHSGCDSHHQPVPATPFFGDQVVIWLRGDFTAGDATLSRCFFSLHYLFPFIGAVIVHLVALHTVKSSNPSGIDLAAKDNIPFHPYFTIKDLYGLGLFRCTACSCSSSRTADWSGQQYSGQSHDDAGTTSFRNGISCRSTRYCARCRTWWVAWSRWSVGDHICLHAVS